MKPNGTFEDESRLRGGLAAWQVNAALPPRFRERVWQRIQRREAQLASSPWERWFNPIAAAFARPRLAVSYVTVLLAAGLLAGYWQGQVTKARAAETLSARYVQTLDPYQMPRH